MKTKMMKMLRRCGLLLVVLVMTVPSRADEGMWLPSLIGERIRDMRQKGFRLTAEDIYSVNRASMKDAIVLFGGGCTGELVSAEGLLLTNHHCGYRQIQQHSSVEHDYLTNGFWAMNRSEELPNPGLTVAFLVRMDDVTEAVLEGVAETMTPAERDTLIARNTARVIERATEGTHYTASVKPLYYGNQYFIYVTEVFPDVRLVAAPPSAIGKFGGDTDNWMWPRHTGDFSVFRIYAGKDNKPAPYSKENVPYRPKRHFTIATGGVEEGDFTMIYGFPGRTQQYVISDAVDFVLNRSNPLKIDLRTRRLRIFNEEQARDVRTRIQYAAKNASVANAWKKWQGESKGIARLGTIGKKQRQEAAFEAWAADKPRYRDVLPRLKKLYRELDENAFAVDCFNEGMAGIELPVFTGRIAPGTPVSVIRERAGKFYKDYSPAIDRRVAAELFTEYVKRLPARFLPDSLRREIDAAGGAAAYVASVMERSPFATAGGYEALKSDSAALMKALADDPAAALYRRARQGVVPAGREAKRLNAEITELYRTYMQGLREMSPEQDFYPDANLTLRVAYGHVAGYSPQDAVWHVPYTTLEGIMEKDTPEVYDYNVPQGLRDLHAAKEYGRWDDRDGAVHVAFLATNHTTGGNSGSPILDRRGRLVGINFDRTWLSTMSDIEFDPSVCRNIAVDIRYVLFLIDRLGGAGYLIEEMTLEK